MLLPRHRELAGPGFHRAYTLFVRHSASAERNLLFHLMCSDKKQIPQYCCVPGITGLSKDLLLAALASGRQPLRILPISVVHGTDRSSLRRSSSQDSCRQILLAFCLEDAGVACAPCHAVDLRARPKSSTMFSSSSSSTHHPGRNI